MILVDTNLLLYAHVVDFPQHAAARKWLDGRINGIAPVGMPWESLTAFLRLVTNPRVFDAPEPPAAAWTQVSAWLSCSNVWIPQPTERHSDLLGELVAATGAHANLIPDAHLAAIAIEHGLVLCSTDGDFARFPGLRWEDPLGR